MGIVAGYGPLGLDRPRLVVQVKSGDDPVDVTGIRELQGAMQSWRRPHYERLPDSLLVELPLKRVWVLVPSGE